MVGSVSGMHASPHRGASVEFAEYRRYIPGDDLRRLDWRAYGRTDRYYVKEFEADTNLRLCILLDVSGSMEFGASNVSKLEYARRLAGTLGYLAIQQSDAVGLTCIGEKAPPSLPPRRTPSHLRIVNDQLEHVVGSGETNLISGLHEFAETVSQRALVVVISDLFVDSEQLRAALEHLRFRKHDLAVFHLLDDQEISFDFSRPTRFVDMEGDAAVFADPVEVAQRYQKVVAGYLESIRKISLETAVDYQRVLLSEDYEQTLHRFLAGRALARSGR
ncbi:MAG: DUF58 domain-containing protein [Rubripirellula sp.]|nr:DUF58 domain-containing protein [Rubripirellula sp.]